MALIKTIPITRLKTNNGQIEGLPKNPRFIRDERFDKLKQSIKELPSMLELRELIVYPQNGHFVTIGGNMRLRAAKDLNHTELPCKVLDVKTPVSQLREIAIKDNIGFGQDDYDLLANEWDDEELTRWGMEIPELDEPEGELIDAEPQIDKAAELNKKWKVKTGDLWQIGEHRLLCGDSTKREDVERLMGQERFDICITSPPYNGGGKAGFKTDYYGKTKQFYQDEHVDDRTEQEWIEFCEEILFRCGEIARDDLSVIVWNVMYNANCRSGYGQVMFRGVQPFTVKETICWDKGHGFPSASKGILSRNWELIFVLSKGEKYHTTQGEDEPRWCKWQVARPDEQADDHKATFPTELATRALSEFSQTSAVCYEPFAGSGTTLVACQNLNRKCYAIEISENYCAVVLERMQTAFPEIEIKRGESREKAKI